MPGISITDLNNAQLDANTIASVATSSALTVTDRLGNSKYTLSGINAAMLASAAATQGSIGYLPPVAYAAGISLTLAAQTVSYTGQTYAPILSALPFTTSGTFEAAKFRLIQGVSSADLSAKSGASGVGFSQNDVGSIPRNLLQKEMERVSVLDYGAIMGDDSAATAVINRNAFRAACKSMKANWNAWKVGKAGRAVYVPPGDWNLSNGFTVPKGCSIYSDGLGVARIKILGATADTVSKIPLVSLGRVIDDATGITEVTTGPYVQDPAPEITGLYLNPQNSNTALDVTGVPGFKVGSLWIQADVGINVGDGTSDGIIGSLFLEDSTGTGIRLGACQNIIFGEVYTFLCNTPLEIAGNCNNIDIGLLQANYSKVSVVQTLDNVVAGRVNIGKLICNQNGQFGTFISVLRTRSTACDLQIGEADFRNYNGYAYNNESGLGNAVRIGSLKLRQTPNSSNYSVGTTAKGFRVNNSSVSIGYLDYDGLADSPIEISGAFAANVLVQGGTLGVFTAANPVVNISNTAPSTNCTLRGLINNSGKSLFNAQTVFNPKFSDVQNPFPIVTENTRLAIKIPFSLPAGMWEVTVSANTNPAGNSAYRRLRQFVISQETSYTTLFVTTLTQTTLVNTAANSGFTPDISLQLDINTVGAGATLAYSASGFVVISVPNSYASLDYRVRQLV